MYHTTVSSVVTHFGVYLCSQTSADAAIHWRGARGVCAADAHIGVRSAAHGERLTHLRPPCVSIETSGWVSVNNSRTPAPRALPLGASTHTHAGHTFAARDARASTPKNFDSPTTHSTRAGCTHENQLCPQASADAAIHCGGACGVCAADAHTDARSAARGFESAHI